MGLDMYVGRKDVLGSFIVKLPSLLFPGFCLAFVSVGDTITDVQSELCMNLPAVPLLLL